MDTPGGLDRSMREIIHLVLGSTVPVITYVAPSGARAASAGTFILYASHLAAMAPATNLGAATPIQLGGPPQPMDDSRSKDGEKQMPRDAGAAKAVNDAVAYIRGLARLQGRNAEWAEEAVRHAASLPAEEALEKQVIELIAPDLTTLLERADGRTVQLAGAPVRLATAGSTLRVLEPNWRNHLLAVITDPNVALILMLIGIYGIVFEFMNPGLVFPGVIGAISLLVGLFALNTLPLNYAGVALLLLGLAFMTAEAFLPSFGALGIGGAVAFAIGAIMMFDLDGAPGFKLAPGVAIGAAIASAAFFLLVVSAALRSRRRPVVTGAEQLLGSTGVVTRLSDEGGWARVHGEEWSIRSRGGSLRKGGRIKVVDREGLTLLVDPLNE